METTENSEPTITLPLRTYLDHLFTYKSTRDHILCRVACLDRAEGEWIKQHDPGERFCHVELNPDTPNVAQVWPVAEWKTHYIRQQQLKAASEKSRQNKVDLELAKSKMVVCILEDPEVGPLFDGERAMEYVNKIIRDKKFKTAAKFGCGNLEELLT